MRGKEIPIHLKEAKLTVSIDSHPMLIVIDQGKAKSYHLPNFGETVVVCHNGKVKRIKIEEGEEF
ncbi:XtrA/YqaO family protein [Salipaludibacillus sp. LMS25]|uniref:XtrA/YqaO family protein n=1 Tax=Salipaludibacillus sp. LMS25 TaxID=2924031 RepID=UPI0020D08076|nr:XtrA/YqaO family protein [Salipaludibacillus sp. LMS25]UTR16850.1 XtrA/YqaO family protein [Salipaludibacillus sp. LMS25]